MGGGGENDLETNRKAPWRVVPGGYDSPAHISCLTAFRGTPTGRGAVVSRSRQESKPSVQAM